MTRSRILLLGAGLLLAALMLTTAGCGQPQLKPEHLELTIKLRTAISAQNPEWLAMNRALIEERRQAGEMSDREYAAFQTILADAEEGRWREAEETCLALQAAQRPPRANQNHMKEVLERSRP